MQSGLSNGTRMILAAFVLSLIVLLTDTLLAGAGEMHLTKEVLQGLKTTSNQPQGDLFVDSDPAKLNSLIDAICADNSLVSPMYLYFAANTALRLGRVEDAAFLFYAAQIRKKFDYQRFNINPQADGNNAATYFGFLNQTIGQNLNPAIMAMPKQFANAIQRLGTWSVVPSNGAYYPDFKEAKGFKLEKSKWNETAQAVKDDFMTHFGKKYSTLLNNQDYFNNFKFVQDCNFGRVSLKEPSNSQRYSTAMQQMHDLENKLTP
jgi:hypothetical protein